MADPVGVVRLELIGNYKPGRRRRVQGASGACARAYLGLGTVRWVKRYVDYERRVKEQHRGCFDVFTSLEELAIGAK